jgi:4-diphosphocytidyl-2-C-methyl-D-erythritol kinase
MKLLSPAKINLFLAVTGKRPDGYHELCMLMCAVSLYDTITLIFDADSRSQKIGVFCDAPDVPSDESNLAHKAASLFLKHAGIRGSMDIFIEKNIPAGAGLGGGSSNAATVLSGLNQHYGFPFSREKLMEMGLKLGADVPFFIFGKPAIATGIGEKLEIYKTLSSFKVLLVYPGFSVSTASVYKNLKLGLTTCKKKIIKASFKDRTFNPEHHLCNDLETVTASLYPEIATIKSLLCEQGARGALMSGSGSAVFGLFSDAEGAEAAKRNFSQNKKWKIFVADMLI